MEKRRAGETLSNRDEALQALHAYLDTLDDETLLTLAQQVQTPEAFPLSGQQPLSRRGFLKGVLLMGLLGSLSTTGAAYAGFRSGKVAGRTAAEIRLSLEIARLRGLLALYQSLEAVGIDRILEQGLASVGALLNASDIGLAALGQGLNSVALGLERLETLLDGFSDQVNAAKSRLEGILHLFQSLLNRVRALLEPAEQAGNLVLALGNKILGRLPFGLADKVRPFFQDVAQVVEDVPAAVEEVLNDVLDPIQELWLQKQGSVGLYPWVIQPFRERVLTPWREQVETWRALVQHWHQDLVEPASEALEERKRIRAQIESYRL